MSHHPASSVWAYCRPLAVWSWGRSGWIYNINQESLSWDLHLNFSFVFLISQNALCVSIWSIITKFWTPNTFKNINILSEKLGKIHFFFSETFQRSIPIVCLPSWCIINKTTPDTLITILLNFLTGNEIHFICGGKILRVPTTFTNYCKTV